MGGLGVNPQEALLRALGQQTLMLLVLIVALPVLAARLPLGAGRWLQPLLGMRRLLGLWAFAYTAIHLAAHWQFEHDLVLGALGMDAVTRPFVTLGLLATLLLLPLALTSTRAAQRRLGPRWKQLHRLVWPATALGVVHYLLHKMGKNDLSDPLAVGLLLAVLYAVSRAQRARAQLGRRTIPSAPPAADRPMR